MNSSDLGEKVKAKAYLTNNIKVEADKTKRAKVLQSKKAKKAKQSKMCTEAAVAALFELSVADMTHNNKDKQKQKRHSDEPTSIHSSNGIITPKGTSKIFTPVVSSMVLSNSYATPVQSHIVS